MVVIQHLNYRKTDSEYNIWDVRTNEVEWSIQLDIDRLLTSTSLDIVSNPRVIIVFKHFIVLGAPAK